jgi:hypothetical protein
MSDATGIARFYEPPASWGTLLTVKCKNIADLRVDLTDPNVFSPPAPPPMRVRPPLTRDPASYSQAELLAGGYPPRPPAGTPMYDEWLKLVSKPGFGVEQAPTAMLGIQHGGPIRFYTSHIWSGPELLMPQFGGLPYGDVWGHFNVPTIIPNDNLGPQFSTMWIGLGGDPNWGSGPLAQLGIDANYLETCKNYAICSYYPQYYTWAEYYPGGTSALNVTIHANDAIFANTYPSDAFGNFNPNGGSAYFHLEDGTTQQYKSAILPIPAGYAYNGRTAEAIFERPQENNVQYPLTQVSGASMAWFFALDINNGDLGVVHNMSTDVWQGNELWSLDDKRPLANWSSSDKSEQVSWTWLNAK